MLVRVNFGRKAGTVQDIEIIAAKAMITDGRASAVSYDEQPKDSPAEQVETAAKKSKKKA